MAQNAQNGQKIAGLVPECRPERLPDPARRRCRPAPAIPGILDPLCQPGAPRPRALAPPRGGVLGAGRTRRRKGGGWRRRRGARSVVRVGDVPGPVGARAAAGGGGGRGGSAEWPDHGRGPGCSTRSGDRSPPPPPCSAPPPSPPVEPRRRAPPAGVRPRLPHLGDAEAVARARTTLAGAAHLPVPAGGRHGMALCRLVRRRGPRVRRRGGVREIIEGAALFGLAQTCAACGAHRLAPGAELPLRALPAGLGEPGRGRHAAQLDHSPGCRCALKSAPDAASWARPENGRRPAVVLADSTTTPRPAPLAAARRAPHASRAQAPMDLVRIWAWQRLRLARPLPARGGRRWRRPECAPRFRGRHPQALYCAPEQRRHAGRKRGRARAAGGRSGNRQAAPAAMPDAEIRRMFISLIDPTAMARTDRCIHTAELIGAYSAGAGWDRGVRLARLLGDTYRDMSRIPTGRWWPTCTGTRRAPSATCSRTCAGSARRTGTGGMRIPWRGWKRCGQRSRRRWTRC